MSSIAYYRQHPSQTGRGHIAAWIKAGAEARRGFQAQMCSDLRDYPMRS